MFKNLSVGKKMSVSFGFVLSMLAAAVVVALFSLRAVSRSLDDFHDHPYALSNTVWEMKDTMTAAQRNIFRATSLSSLRETQEAVALARANIDRLDELYGLLRTQFEGDPRTLDALGVQLDAARAESDRIFTLASTNDNVQASRLIDQDYIPVASQARAMLDEVGGLVTAEAARYRADAHAVNQRAVAALLALAAVSYVAGILLARKIRFSVVGPLRQIERASGQIARGEIRAATIDYASKDELGTLADSMRATVRVLDNYVTDISVHMAKLADGDLCIAPTVVFEGDFIELRDSILGVVISFNEALVQIDRASNMVSGGADSVASGAQVLAQGATEQAGTVEELAATIAEISEHVKATAENAAEANARTADAGAEVNRCDTRMRALDAAMGEISRTSERIALIIKTIEDIAFQTNILALNAAVEAARAGAAGKGFAVVADEVRNLASKSAEAADSTTALIEESLAAVRSGAGIAKETAASLRTVVDKAQSVTTVVDRITKAADEQAQAIAMVTGSVEQISSVIANNSATAEESAASAEQLAGQATLLKELVNRFHLRGEKEAAMLAKLGIVIDRG